MTIEEIIEKRRKEKAEAEKEKKEEGKSQSKSSTSSNENTEKYGVIKRENLWDSRPNWISMDKERRLYERREVLARIAFDGAE